MQKDLCLCLCDICRDKTLNLITAVPDYLSVLSLEYEENEKVKEAQALKNKPIQYDLF